MNRDTRIRVELAETIELISGPHGYLGTESSLLLINLVCWYVIGNCYDNREPCDPITDEMMQWSLSKMNPETRRVAETIFTKTARGDWIIQFLRPSRPGIAAKVRKLILQRDGRRCRQCGNGNRLEIDHVIPWSKGGSHDETNFQVLCRPCNQAKRDHLPS